MATTPLAAIVAVFLFSAASFFFALAETALFSLANWQIQQLAQRHPGPGGILSRLLAEPHDLLATIALGNTFATAAMLATALPLALGGVWPLGLTIAALVLVILIGCEVLPKTMAVRHPETWALRLARPLRVLERLSAPLRWVAQRLDAAILKVVIPPTVQRHFTLTEADYQELLDLAYQQGALARSEKEIILQILSLDRRTAREVMKPRAQMAAVSDDASLEEMIEAARKFRHRRLPIYDETLDTIVGVLNTRALLLNPAIDLADAVEFPSFVPESMNLLQLLKSLQRQQRGLAIVLDEFGGTAGLVTLDDILEEILGPMRRDQRPPGFLMERLAPGRWRVSGTLRLDDFRRECPALEDVSEVETLGGLLVHLLGAVPAPGESATWRNLRLTAQVTDERTVRELLVELIK
ncbi:MAG TPA: hemolysin family protein [Candidatus Paceibacterota bacterium]|nr:hemolysin family protein [Candidatus Paceibacterota bacterium]